MLFDDVESVQEFYMNYAHDIGFSVRIGQQKLDDNGVVQWKRFLCARQGYRKQQTTAPVDPTKKNKKAQNTRETRCGCEAYMYFKRNSEGKYKIGALHEDHNHELVTPSKQHLLRSKRFVSEKAKTTLLLHVGAGGFEYVGCTKKDLQNYYSDFRNKIKDADAQMFIDQFGRLKEVDPGFFFEYEVNDGRKNYSHFGDVVSFDSTYSTNQYDMKFAPFTGVNHHMQSVFFGAAFIADEKIESYVWLFQTFLRAIGEKHPKLIITDEDASMRAAIASVLPSTMHRLCMWHIMKKFPEKIGPHLLQDEEFWKRVNLCVWGSETTEEFESRWLALLSDYNLGNNDWLEGRYRIRESWIPAYFKDIWLGGILRTTSRSESANSFFNRFIGRKLALIEFWLRFDTPLQCQRQEELIHDNTTLHTNPTLLTTWEIEKHGSYVFTHEVFEKFQEEVLAAREYCDSQSTTELEDRKIVTMTDNYRRIREVICFSTEQIYKCSCMLFESIGIPCRHIIRMFRGARLNEIPQHYITKRWMKNCKRNHAFDSDGNLLVEKATSSMAASMRRKMSSAQNKFEDIFQRAKTSEEGIDVLIQNLESLSLLFDPSTQTKQQEQENFIGCSIPNDVQVHPPNDTRAKGKCKRILGHADKNKRQKDSGSRKCTICKDVGHDRRNCPKKESGADTHES
ncbi:hypothetical protein PVAP13_5KG398207 [Panicum virgatum]|uniref:SWIM-type domain-containing protein n=1 Tax=Panicum virgatum TaxID=38727 RepID=A0A8T0SRH4_PANVG|nr:hypothetical protein PVAP13_5KG398207 [Panicum virgatum]